MVIEKNTINQTFVAYCDVNAVIDMNFKGIKAPNKRLAEQVVKMEVEATINLRIFEYEKIENRDIEIYWKNVEETEKSFNGDALVTYRKTTRNRKPVTGSVHNIVK